jgi:hypothetical protein
MPKAKWNKSDEVPVVAHAQSQGEPDWGPTDCRFCYGSFPESMILFIEKDNGPDYGPVCSYCFDRLLTLADKKFGIVRYEGFGGGLVIGLADRGEPK